MGGAAGGDDSLTALLRRVTASPEAFKTLYLGLKENAITVGAANGLYFYLCV